MKDEENLLTISLIEIASVKLIIIYLIVIQRTQS